MADLTTLFLFKTYANIPTEDTDKQIGQIITAVSKAVESYCNRSFEQATYKRWLDGTGESYLLLPEYPVISLYGVSTGRNQNVLKITNTSATFATVTATATGLTLFSVDTAGVETESSETYAGNPTIDDLATAVNALSAAGWSATTTSGQGTMASVLIRPTAGVYTVSPDDLDLEVADETTEVHIVPDTNSMIERQAGLFFSCGVANIFAWWKAGYTLPVDDAGHTKLETEGTLPRDLVQIVNMIVKASYDSAEQDIGSAADQNTIDYKSKIDEGGRGIIDKMISECAQALTPYRRLL